MTDKTGFSLLGRRRFLPLFLSQFLGAFNDNLVKNALAILILFRLAAGTETGAGTDGQILVTAATGIFILPYMLFGATAGQLADRFEKSGLIRLCKLLEIGLMAAAAYGFLTADVWLLMGVLFGLGVQATFFSPLKYAILPDHLGRDELVAGNALIEAGTFLAILAGTVVGGALVLADGGVGATAALAVAVAAAGAVAAWFVPKTPVAAPGLRIDPNPLRETRAILRAARADRTIWLSILGISWFWLFGAVLLSQFPALTKDVIGADEHVVTLLLVVFSVGVGVGSILCNRLLAGAISARYVPFAALGMSVFGLDLYLAVDGYLAAGVGAAGVGAASASLIGAAEFLAGPGGWRIVADLFLLAVCGGLYSIPLYVIVQDRSPEAQRARMVAANNVMNAVFMVGAAAASAAMLAAGVGVPGVILATVAANTLVALHICRLLPQEIVRNLFRWYFRTFHDVQVRGLEHAAAAGPRTVIVCNHQSFLDGCLLAAFLPGEATFAVHTAQAAKWWVRIFLSAVGVFAVDPANPYATKAMVRAVRAGKRLVIFPEGRITTTGGLMKIYDGSGLVADKAEADILPVRIDGLVFSRLSRMAGKMPQRLFPRIRLTVAPPRALTIPAGLRGRARRRAAADRMQDIMTETAFRAQVTDVPLFAGLIEARDLYGADTEAVRGIEFATVQEEGGRTRETAEQTGLSYGRLVLASAVLGRRLAALTAPGETVGVLLPNAIGTVVTFFALQAHARVPAMLNFSAGADSMRAACAAAGVRTVLTSRRFVAKGKLDKTVEALAASTRIVYLEDIRTRIGLADKIAGKAASLFPGRLPGLRVAPDAPAVVLFTSGSEGAPKGVVLSHRNIVANIRQVASVVDFTPADKVFNPMPMFHSFGLTGGTLLPVLSGVPVFLYPNPLHYKIVCELIYDTLSTITFATDTFLNGYARVADPYDLHALRYVFAGAEPVKEQTRLLFMKKFRKAVLEGYGATETAPVLALNTLKAGRDGTVGRFLPGVEHRLEPVPGIEAGGRLQVRGPNVALGYLQADAPGVLQPLGTDGWYDMGDIVALDADGYVTIKGRAKRFAKIGGEMVSLTAAEAFAAALWSDAAHAVVAIPDPRKGEQLVLVTTQADADRRALLARGRERGIAELTIPRTVLITDRIPLLGTGKTDYPAVQKLVAGAVLPTEPEVAD